MLDPTIEQALNDQVAMEAQSSQFYLSMAIWAETNGLDGTANFLYRHSNEEREHMLKLIHFINERGGKAQIPALTAPQSEFAGLSEIFNTLLDHEGRVTQSINNVVDLCLSRKDFTTHHFMQWYVAEQIEEEALARSILDKLHLIGEDTAGLYLFDRDLGQLEPGA